MRFVYPEGKKKALTFSYDDGQVFDERLAGLFTDHGMKATFHLNSGKLGIHRGKDHYVSPEDVCRVYAGHEVACHGVEHRSLPRLLTNQMLAEIGEDRKALEEITGGLVQGMSYAYGDYNEEVKKLARMLGIKYSRTIEATKQFYPPEDFLEWHPTCHHRDNIMELSEQFMNLPPRYELPVMYVWGHSFEFGWPDDWTVIEQFVEKMAGMEDIWYATNMEICNYVEAVRRQEFSADGMTMYNPTAQSIWVSTEAGIVMVAPGETKYIGR